MAEFGVTQDDLQRLARDLKGFDDRREILKAFRKTLREPLPELRIAIRASAVANLPSGHGLGEWVAKASITSSARVTTGRSAGISIKGGRNSSRHRSDLRRIDAGRVRAPSWGRRGKDDWHTQTVTVGFFSKPVKEYSERFGRAADAAIAQALGVLHGRR